MPGETDNPLDPIAILTRDMDRTYYSEDPTAGPPKEGKNLRRRPPTPKEVAALELHRKGTYFGGPNIRKCRSCGRVAVRKLEVCYFHGGRKVVEARKRAKGKLVGSRAKMARKRVFDAIKHQLIPPELAREPAFQATWAVAQKKLLGSGDFDPAKLARRTAASILAWELVLAWHLFQKGEHQPWMEAIRKAKTLAFI